MTVFLSPRVRRRPSQAEFWRRRATVILTFVTIASTPALLSTNPSADAASAAPEPIRAAAAIQEVRRVGAGPSTSLPPRATPAPISMATASVDMVLGDSRIVLSENARADLKAGLVDPKLIAVVNQLSTKYRIELSVFATGHGRFVKGTNKVSNHVLGRAVDIIRVNGAEVSSSNAEARALLDDLLAMNPSIRPTEVGGPWDVDGNGPVGFTDNGHQSHLHVGFD